MQWIWMNHRNCLITYFWDVLNVITNQTKKLLDDWRRCSNRVFLPEQLKNYQDGKNFTQKSVAWSHDGMRNSKIRWEILRIDEKEDPRVLQSFESLFLDDHHFGELSEVYSQIVLKCLFLSGFGRSDIRWAVSDLTYSISYSMYTS